MQSPRPRLCKTNDKIYTKKNYFCSMHIPTILTSYLRTHQKIGLTGIGEFSLKKINGFYETQTNTLYPPATHILFEEVEVLDFDFANYISTQQNIAITEAQLQLDSWLLNIKAELISGNTYLLEKIGSLKLNHQKIQFTSFNDAYFNQASFGFKPQQNVVLNANSAISEGKLSPEIKDANPEEYVLEIKKEIIVDLKNELEFEGKILPKKEVESSKILPISKVPQPETSNMNTPPKPPKQKIDWFWIIAIILVCLTGAIVCATFIYFPPFNSVETTETPIKLANAKADSLAAIQNKPDTTLTYEIIVAENLTPLKAQKQLLKLKSVGIYGHLITNDSNIIVQISVAKFLQLDSAQAKLKQIQQKYYPKAYLKTTTDIN